MEIQTEALLKTMPVTEAEILAHGRANPDVFKDPETRIVEIIQALTKHDAVEARRKLKARMGWPEAQQLYGVKPFNLYWTGTRTLKENTAPHDAFGQGLFTSRRHKIVGPIHTLNGWFVFEVLKIIPPHFKGLPPKSRINIRDMLQAIKLDGVLHRGYDSITHCAQQYQLPEAPECTPASNGDA